MLTFYLASLGLTLFAAAALLAVGLSTQRPVTVRAEDLLPRPAGDQEVLPALRPLTTGFRPCTGCERTTEASIHRNGHTCLTCFTPHPAPVTS